MIKHLPAQPGWGTNPRAPLATSCAHPGGRLVVCVCVCVCMCVCVLVVCVCVCMYVCTLWR